MDESQKWNPQRVGFYFLSGLAIALGVSLIAFTRSEALHSVGDALIIAGVLSLTVDQYVKARLLKEVAQDVAKFLVGYRLPEEIQDRIRETMAIAFVRRDYRHRYRLSELPDGRIKLDVSFECTVENITGSPQPYSFKIGRDPSDSPTFYELGLSDREGTDLFRLNGDQLVPKMNGFRVQVASPPKDLQPRSQGKSYFIFGRYSTIPLRNYDDHGYGGPTIGVTVWAEWPEGYLFEPIGLLGEGSAARERPAIQTSGIWVFNRLLMPGDRLAFAWVKAGKLEAPTPAQPWASEKEV